MILIRIGVIILALRWHRSMLENSPMETPKSG
jgi:hypothetical protein